MNKLKKQISVGISNMPPLVIQNKKEFTGFEIELWEKIATALSLNYNYKEIKFTNIISKIEDKTVDVAIAGITRTEEREKKIDFSHSTLNSGLLILLNKKSKKHAFSFKTLSKKMFYIFLSILGLIILFANGIWFIEKNSNTFSSSYLEGIFESIWYTTATIATVGYGDFTPHTILGKLFAMLIIICGITIFGLFIAELTTFLTLTKRKYQISSFNDLKNKKVATKTNTTSVNELIKIGSKITTVKEIDEAYNLLEKNKVDAVIFDAPIIQYLIKNQEEEKFISVGEIFAPQTYGIAMQENSKLKELINREIFRLRESGEYDFLYKKWFENISLTEN